VADLLGAMLEQGCVTVRPPRPPQWALDPPGLPFGITFPGPRAATIGVLGMLAFGVIIGSTVSPNWTELPAASPLLLAVRPHISPLADLTSAAENSLAGGGADAGARGAGGGGTITVTVTQTTPAPSTSTLSGASQLATATGGSTSPASGAGGSTTTPNLHGLPAIHHVFLIVLADQGFKQTFGFASQDAYLSKTLPATGELIDNYYAVAGSELANEIALLSGQGPTPETQADCPVFAPIKPGRIAKSSQQALGTGCVYPSSAKTLPEELIAKGYTWKAYIAGMDLGPPGQPTACRHPPLGKPDPDHSPRTGDSYVTWLNPFVYFGGLIGSHTCAKNDVGQEGLESDLQNPSKAPTFAYIAPSPCADGSAQPCAPGAPAGLAPADSFLQTIIPEIESSPAYKDHGLIAITFDQAPQTGPDADSSACCEYPAYPNLAHARREAAGATITPTAITTTPTTPTSTTPTPTTPTPTTPTPTTPTSTTPTTTTPTTTTPTSTTPTTTTPTTTTPTTTTPTTTTATTSPPATPFGTGGTQTRPTGGGGQVGLLLISRYVQKGSIDAVDYYNHYSLLATIEDMFGLKTLGYAADKSLPVLDAGVFNGQQ
jgi:hypothetical protein